MPYVWVRQNKFSQRGVERVSIHARTSRQNEIGRRSIPCQISQSYCAYAAFDPSTHIV